MIRGKQFDGDLCATLHRCTLHFTAKVGRMSEMVLDGDTCATYSSLFYIDHITGLQLSNGSMHDIVC